MEQHKLASHHRATAQRILGHPTSHNIEWHDVVSLISEIGTITEKSNDRFLVTIAGETQTFDKPRGDDIDAQQVVDLRRMLVAAGITVDPTKE